MPGSDQKHVSICIYLRDVTQFLDSCISMEIAYCFKKWNQKYRHLNKQDRNSDDEPYFISALTFVPVGFSCNIYLTGTDIYSWQTQLVKPWHERTAFLTKDLNLPSHLIADGPGQLYFLLMRFSQDASRYSIIATESSVQIVIDLQDALFLCSTSVQNILDSVTLTCGTFPVYNNRQ